MYNINLDVANNFFKRLKGLMFKESIDENYALLFINTNRIHTSFMKFPIAVHYLDENFKTIDYEIIEPWKIGKKVEGAKHVIETSPTIIFKDTKLIEALKNYLKNK